MREIGKSEEGRDKHKVSYIQDCRVYNHHSPMSREKAANAIQLQTSWFLGLAVSCAMILSFPKESVSTGAILDSAPFKRLSQTRSWEPLEYRTVYDPVL